MDHRAIRALVFSVLGGLTFIACVSDPDATAQDGAAPPAATAAGSQAADADAASRDLLTDMANQTDIAEEKILGLAQAIPEEDYGWRPGEGVRSVAEVFIHLAADNYFIPVLMGVEAPAETGITTDFSTVDRFQNRDLTKEQILAEVEASFRFLDDAMAQTRGDLNRTFEFGRTTYAVGAMWVQAVTHVHEHLGQMIAYARSNGVVPPWSQ